MDYGYNFPFLFILFSRFFYRDFLDAGKTQVLILVEHKTVSVVMPDLFRALWQRDLAWLIVRFPFENLGYCPRFQAKLIRLQTYLHKRKQNVQTYWQYEGFHQKLPESCDIFIGHNNAWNKFNTTAYSMSQRLTLVYDIIISFKTGINLSTSS